MHITAEKRAVTVRLTEIEQYLKRAFRVLRPHRGPLAMGTEITIELSLSENVVIRVLTSVHRGQEVAAGTGKDAIRVGLFVASGRPLKAGEKLPIVQRTEGWRDNLRKRIEAEIEEYDDREGYWESRATGVPTRYAS